MTETEKKKAKRADVPLANDSSTSARLPRSLTTILIVAVVLPYLAVIGYIWQNHKTTSSPEPTSVATSATENAPTTSGATLEKASLLKPGPWGDVEYVPLMIESPDEYLSAQGDSTSDRRWFFQGFTPDTLKQYFNSILELTSTERQQLVNAKQESTAKGIYITPPRELIFSMSSEARKKIYRLLTQFSENNWQQEAYVFPITSFDSYFKDSGLSTETISLVRRLCYTYGKTLLFADLPYVLDTLPTFEQKKLLEKAVSRRSTLLLRLHVNPRSDVTSLINYWGRAGTAKDLKPLLQSVAKLPQGERVNIALMMPPLPTSRLYTYPFPSFNQPENCHWTSFNFFRDPPDNRFTDIKYIRERLDSDYYPMFTDPRYGDLLFLTKPNGDIIHSAVFIADDVVFTKNGGHFSAPWMFMRIPELVEYYSTFVAENEAVKVVYYRNKYF